MSDVTRFRALDVVRAAFSERRTDETIKLGFLTKPELLELLAIVRAAKLGPLAEDAEARFERLQWKARRREELGLDVGPDWSRVSCVGGAFRQQCTCLEIAFEENLQVDDREVILTRARVLHEERNAAREAEFERLREDRPLLPRTVVARPAPKQTSANRDTAPCATEPPAQAEGPPLRIPELVESSPGEAEPRFLVSAEGNRVEVDEDGKPIKPERAADGRQLPRGGGGEPRRSPKWYDRPGGDGWAGRVF